MKNVTIISTEHIENGKCNSDELHKIIQSIGPDVIFEEETNDETYQKYYSEEYSFNSLEIRCIKKYLRNNNIMHIPVDIGLNQAFVEWDYMFGTFKKYAEYRNIDKRHCAVRAKDGFHYLNSERCMELLDEIKTIERQIIEFSGLNKHELFRVYDLFHKEHDNRESAMLMNIYKYSKENPYNQAVFLLGYAHRKSMKQKIKEYETKANLNLNWSFYTQTY